jgi:hypothetical protein
MKRLSWMAAVLCLCAAGAAAQQSLHTPILMGVGGTPLDDQRQDDRIDHLPLAREDRTLMLGRQERQTAAVSSVRQVESAEAEDGRIRAREILDADRERVKREVAIED